MFREEAYLSLVSDILQNGEQRDDRTGTGVISIFAPPSMSFSLQGATFPLLTTKMMTFRIIAEELMWFIRGQTDVKILQDRNVHIWDKNGKRNFLIKQGLVNNRKGDLGPVYGFQWRHFGAQYTSCDADYQGQGVDQLREVIRLIRDDPYNRRIIMSAWNPSDLKKMALPPCHVMAQFFVSFRKPSIDDVTLLSSREMWGADEDGRVPYLSCQMYQRSCDVGLGVPFNIASYALLTHLIAYVTGCLPDKCVHCMGDAHVYMNHIEPLREQVTRVPRRFPTLKIQSDRAMPRMLRRARPVDDMLKELEDFDVSQFELRHYTPWPKIPMEMSA